jgi:WD40 repeat protein
MLMATLQIRQDSVSRVSSPYQPTHHSACSIGSTPQCSPSHLYPPSPVEETRTRSWKDVYPERFNMERSGRGDRCSLRTLKGHTNSIMCLQFSETFPHLLSHVLITGSYDRTARVWNLETGEETRCIKGHTRALCALRVCGSMRLSLSLAAWITRFASGTGALEIVSALWRTTQMA